MKLSVLAHVEIDSHEAEDKAREMHGVLELHFQDCFGEGFSATKFSQSFDQKKNIFRFDLKPQGNTHGNQMPGFDSLVCE